MHGVLRRQGHDTTRRRLDENAGTRNSTWQLNEGHDKNQLHRIIFYFDLSLLTINFNLRGYIHEWKKIS